MRQGSPPDIDRQGEASGGHASIGSREFGRVIRQAQYDGLQRTIFAPAGRAWYAVLDGAQIDNVAERLAKLESACLFLEELDPVLKEAAPYVVKLDAGSAAADLALREGWNSHWGIVLETDASVDLPAIRSHLRTLLRVRAPDGTAAIFRFYDPRAFRTVVPRLDDAQRAEFYGPIHACWVEGQQPDTALRFRRSGGPEPEALPLPAAS